MWQDVVIAIVQWVLFIALIPSIRHPHHKPVLWSSILIGTSLFILAVMFFTLELWHGAAATFFSAAGWAILAYQRWQLNKKMNPRP